MTLVATHVNANLKSTVPHGSHDRLPSCQRRHHSSFILYQKHVLGSDNDQCLCPLMGGGGGQHPSAPHPLPSFHNLHEQGRGTMAGSVGTLTSSLLASMNEAYCHGIDRARVTVACCRGKQLDVVAIQEISTMRNESWPGDHLYDIAYLAARGFNAGLSDALDAARLDTRISPALWTVLCQCPKGPDAPTVFPLCGACTQSQVQMDLVRGKSQVTTAVNESKETYDGFVARNTDADKTQARIVCEEGVATPSSGVAALGSHAWAYLWALAHAIPTGSHEPARRHLVTQLETGTGVGSPAVFADFVATGTSIHTVAAALVALKEVIDALGPDVHPFVAWNHGIVLLCVAMEALQVTVFGPAPGPGFEYQTLVTTSATFADAAPVDTPRLGDVYFDAALVGGTAGKQATFATMSRRTLLGRMEHLVALAHGHRLHAGHEAINRAAVELFAQGTRAPGCVQSTATQGTLSAADDGGPAGAGAGAGAGADVPVPDGPPPIQWVSAFSM